VFGLRTLLWPGPGKGSISCSCQLLYMPVYSNLYQFFWTKPLQNQLFPHCLKKMAPSGRTTTAATSTRTASKTTTTTTTTTRRTRQQRRTAQFKKKQQQQPQHTKSNKKQETDLVPTVLPSSCSSISSQDSSKEVDMQGSEVIDVSLSPCSTPKGQKFRIPEISTCPPAPKKPRVLSNCSLRRSPLSFFVPPDLEHFFLVALRDVSVWFCVLIDYWERYMCYSNKSWHFRRWTFEVVLVYFLFMCTSSKWQRYALRTLDFGVFILEIVTSSPFLQFLLILTICRVCSH